MIRNENRQNIYIGISTSIRLVLWCRWSRKHTLLLFFSSWLSFSICLSLGFCSLSLYYTILLGPEQWTEIVCLWMWPVFMLFFIRTKGTSWNKCKIYIETEKLSRIAEVWWQKRRFVVVVALLSFPFLSLFLAGYSYSSSYSCFSTHQIPTKTF